MGEFAWIRVDSYRERASSTLPASVGSVFLNWLPANVRQ